jgi:hypothetical protein
MVYFGRVKKGLVVVESRSRLPDGLRVRIEPMHDGVDDPAYRLWELAVDAGPADLSEQHDHYLYGAPKRRGRARGPRSKAKVGKSPVRAAVARKRR